MKKSSEFDKYDKEYLRYASKKVPKKYLIQDTILTEKIYPLVAEKMPTKLDDVKSCIGRFIHTRHDALYDYAPIDRIYFRKHDVDDFFNSIDIKMKDISNILPDLYYWKDNELQATKDEFSLTALMMLRWILKNKSTDEKSIELIYMYLAFSGKFYASCHYYWFRSYLPKRQVMDYVINYMLSNKFDLIKTKSVWGAMRNLTKTWVDTYKEELISDGVTDERIVYMIHQLYGRIQAFLRNIAKLYYEANDNKLYLNSESDKYEEDGFRIANNNSTIIASVTENTMNYMSTTQVSLQICTAVATKGVDPTEIKAIFENILSNRKNMDQLRYVINVLLVDFTNRYPEETDLIGPKFIAHSIAMKPNTKDQDIINVKNTVLEWLSTSERYRNIKTQATKNNYFKAILSYIAITINIANKDKI